MTKVPTVIVLGDPARSEALFHGRSLAIDGEMVTRVVYSELDLELLTENHHSQQASNLYVDYPARDVRLEGIQRVI